MFETYPCSHLPFGTQLMDTLFVGARLCGRTVAKATIFVQGLNLQWEPAPAGEW